MEAQQIQEELDRALVLPPQLTGISATLPTPAASMCLKWAPDGKSIVNSALDPDVGATAAATSATAAATSASQASTSATNAATSATNAGTSATNAGNSASQAAASAASVSLPAMSVAIAGDFLQVNAGGTGYEANTATRQRTAMAAAGLGDDNTFTGNNTFSNPVVVPNALTATEAIPKGQADTLYAPITSNAIAVRQTVASGPLTASGTANHITAGTGLAANLSTNGGANPVTVNYAAGSSLTGDVNYVNRVMADVANAWSGLPANNLSFISTDYSAGGPTYTQKLAPHQEGYAYNQAAQSVLQFGGAAGSTTFLDDFGNTWTAQGGAKVQTNQVKFGTGALGGSGANNALNGSTDYIKTTNITTFGSGGWSFRCWIYPTSLAAYNGIFSATNGAGYGALLDVLSTGHFNLDLSSNGSSFDIANGAQGTSAVTVNTWNFIELTYDPVAGKYFVYVNGASDITIASTAKICTLTSLVSGARLSTGTQFFSGYIDKPEFLPYCQHPNGTAYTVPTAAPNVAAAGYASDFYSIPQMEMFSVTGPSTAAGVNPTLTPINRVYHGEVTTNGAGVASVTPYAYNGRYVSGRFPVASSNTYYKNHNLGVDTFRVFAYGALTQGGPLNEFFKGYGSTTNYGAFSSVMTRTSVALVVEGGGPAVALPGSYNANPFAVEAVMIAERPW
jgi:hypothetical protein